MEKNTCRMSLCDDVAEAMSNCKAGDTVRCEVEMEVNRAETMKHEKLEEPMSPAMTVMAKKKTSGGKEHRMELSGEIKSLKIMGGGKEKSAKPESKKSAAVAAILAAKKAK